MKILKNLILILLLCTISFDFASGNLPAPQVSLSINTTQGSDLQAVTNAFLIVCIAKGLTLTRWQLSMNLNISIGSSTITFHENGIKRINIEPGDQDYTIDGQGIVELVATNKQGREYRIRNDVIYIGEGTIHLRDNEDNSTVQFIINTDRTRQTSYDQESGEGEFEYTLSLQRNYDTEYQPGSQVVSNTGNGSGNSENYLLGIILIAVIVEEVIRNNSDEESTNDSENYLAEKGAGFSAIRFIGMMGNLGNSVLIKRLHEKRDFSSGVHILPNISFYSLPNIRNITNNRNFYGLKLGLRVIF